MFSWEDEIISTTKTRYFRVKKKKRKLKKVKLYCQQGRENRKLCQCEQITLTTRRTYVGDVNMRLQEKALIKNCSVNKGVL